MPHACREVKQSPQWDLKVSQPATVCRSYKIDKNKMKYTKSDKLKVSCTQRLQTKATVALKGIIARY